MHRLLYHRLLTAALIAGIAIAMALGLAVPLVGSTSAELGLQRQVQAAGAAAGITITEPGIRSLGGFQAFATETTRRVHLDLGDRVGDGATYEIASDFETETLNGKAFSFDVGEAQPTAAYYADFDRRARLVSGSWPTDPGGGSTPALLGAAFAERTGLKEGDVLCMAVPGFIVSSPDAPAERWCARMVGTWEPLDAADPWWGVSTPAASFILSQRGFFDGPGGLPHANEIAGHIAPVRPNDIHAGDADAVLAGISELRSYYSVLGNGSVDTRLQSILEDFQARSQVAAFPLQMIAVALLGVALFFVAFVAAAFLAAHEPTLAVWRGRGWSRGRALSLLLLELGVAAVLALPLAIVGAAAAVLAAGSPPTSLAVIEAVIPTLLAVLALSVLILVVLALTSSRRRLSSIARTRPQAPFWQRRKLDLVVAFLAVPLLFEARVRGPAEVRQAGGAVASDPIAFALPALAIVAVAIVSLRLMDPVARLVGRMHGTAAALAAGRLRRQSTEHARLGLLLVLAVAIGIFSAAYAATETRAAADRVTYAAGADLRIHYTPDSPAAAPANDLARLHGVTGATLVFNQSAGLGNSVVNARIVGIDPASFRAVAYGVQDLDFSPLLKNPDALTIPGRPNAISVWVLSPGIDARLSAVVRDGTGGRCTCSFGDLKFTGWRQLQTSLPQSANYPLRLEALRVDFAAGQTGSTHITLSTLTAAGTESATLSDFGESETDRWFTRVLDREPKPDRLYGDMRNPRDGQSTTTVSILDLAAGSLEIAPIPKTRALPALAGIGTLVDLGTRTSQPVLLRTVGLRDFLNPLASLDRFPTSYPGDDLVVVDRDTLLRRLAASGDRQALPNELWVRERGTGAANLGSLHDDPSVDGIVERASLAAAAQADPLRLALEANLLVGFVAALGMAVAGFGLHFLIASRRRASEYAILRANGLSQATVVRSLLVEQLVMLAFAVPAGLAIGLITAWALLPALELGARPTDVFPPATFTIDPLRMALSMLALASAALALGLTAAGLVRGRPVVEELRALG